MAPSRRAALRPGSEASSSTTKTGIDATCAPTKQASTYAGKSDSAISPKITTTKQKATNVRSIAVRGTTRPVA